MIMQFQNGKPAKMRKLNEDNVKDEIKGFSQPAISV
jgi:hypothetical protein